MTNHVNGRKILPRLQRVLQFVDDNLQNPIHLRDLAAVANLSPFHFSRTFRETTGQSHIVSFGSDGSKRRSSWLSREKLNSRRLQRFAFSHPRQVSRGHLRGSWGYRRPNIVNFMGPLDGRKDRVEKRVRLFWNRF